MIRKRLKVTFYLSSGDRLVLRCDSFEVTKLTGSKDKRALTLTGVNHAWAVDMNEVVAIKSKVCWF